MVKDTLSRLLEICGYLVVIGAAYVFFGWVGFGLSSLGILFNFLHQLVEAHQMTANILSSRLPDRCAICHREIVDEGGVFDADGIYHTECSRKIGQKA